MRPYLIYTSAGTKATVRRWHHPNRNYDIWVTNYSGVPDLHRKYADFYNERAGSKFQNLKHVYQEHGEQLAQYKAIWVMDDDILIPVRWLSALFRTLDAHDLWLLQPAFSRFGRISHPPTARRISTKLRFTNFVETTYPLFRTEQLLRFLEIYQPDMLLSYGTDLWFLDHLGEEAVGKIAVVDQYYCVNPLNIFKNGRREIDTLFSHQERLAYFERFEKTMGLKNPGYKTYGVIKNSLGSMLLRAPLYLIEQLFIRLQLLFRKSK